MTRKALRLAGWKSHVNHVRAPRAMAFWLTDHMSLTRKLMQRCRHFRVQRLMQGHACVLADERDALQLPRRIAVQQREVLLRCDEQPVVYAHTVVPLNATASDWPFFGRLGDRSLGTTLFGDPRVQRGQLEYARLPVGHPLMQRAAVAVGMKLTVPLYARRCLYRRHRGWLLVTEIFLSQIADIGARHIAD